jgi:hypothetical protein
MMKKIGSISAILLSGAMMLTSSVPANAQRMGGDYWQQRDQVIGRYCDSYRNDRDCIRYNRGGWNDRDYANFYRPRQNNLDSIASGLFGFGFGAILGGILANGNNGRGVPIYSGGSYSSHVDACYARYRSYDERSDSFMGYDGVRHRCRL